MFNLHIANMVLIVGLLIFYISDIYKTEKIASDKKILWTIIIFFGHVISMVFYWYLIIWKAPKKE